MWGKIISRSVDVGDHVKANQVLARLDPKDLQNNVNSAKAEVFAQARVTQTRAAFVRQQNCCPRATPAKRIRCRRSGAAQQPERAQGGPGATGQCHEQLGYTALVSDAAG